jgi:gluconate 2-dehydrogenase gamma chain
MTNDLSRRNFLLRAGTGVSAVWLTANWPALVSAAKHARDSVQSAATPKLEFFTPEQAIEIDAITSRIIPTDETPGAHEAGVVYFIDHALSTFAVHDQKTYREGLPELHARTREIFPALQKFSAGTPEQQDEILHWFDEEHGASRRIYQNVNSNFFSVLLTHTITAFLLDPDSGGDPKGTGWRLIGHDREHMFQPPFGYYDKDYPGWQPLPGDADKKS